ncbi:hypothetical protein [Nonomuraea glycinis]|uniref:hypothetical protein n=1 Tax=Nonomuraea glycinis TaxID=2047744 RepID=UPI0033B3B797
MAAIGCAAVILFNVQPGSLSGQRGECRLREGERQPSEPRFAVRGRLRMLLGSWLGGSVDEQNDNSYIDYKLTIDADNRPTSFVLTWEVPVSGSGTYESEFTTTYSGWQKTGKISKP